MKRNRIKNFKKQVHFSEMGKKKAQIYKKSSVPRNFVEKYPTSRHNLPGARPVAQMAVQANSSTNNNNNNQKA
jgi:hypothetical protein